MKKLILLPLLFLACAQKDIAPEPRVPTHTFYVQYIGWQKAADLQKQVTTRLTAHPCLKLKDVAQDAPPEASEGLDCHAFAEFAGEGKIQGDYKKPGGSYLLKVTLIEVDADKKVVFEIQAFKRDGSRLRRFANAGTFTRPTDIQSQKSKVPSLAELTAGTIAGVTFK